MRNNDKLLGHVPRLIGFCSIVCLLGCLLVLIMEDAYLFSKLTVMNDDGACDDEVAATAISNKVIELQQQREKSHFLRKENNDYENESKNLWNDEDHIPDAIVVGSGLAGLSATLTILDRGGTVILIEKESLLGGNSNKASSGMNACCNNSSDERQDSSGDTLEEFQQDTLQSSGGVAAQYLPLISTLTSQSEQARKWLFHRVGIDLSQKVQLGGHSHPRTYRPQNGMVGAVIIYGMLEAIRSYQQQGRVIIMKNTQVTKLLRDDSTGQVVGVEYHQPLLAEQQGRLDDKTSTTERLAEAENPQQTFKAENVILATGGFASDRSSGSYLERYRPEYLQFATTGGKFSTGDGIQLASNVGADTIDMEKVQIHPTGFVDPTDPTNPTKTLAAELLRGVGGILLNSKGKRFCNELGTRAYVTDKMLSDSNFNYAQTKQWNATQQVPTFYLLLSSSAATGAGQKHVQHYMEKKLLMPIIGLDQLALYIGVKKETISQTLGLYANSASQGQDEFGKTTFHGVPQLQQQHERGGANNTGEIFYIGKVTPVLHYCMGGLKINEFGNVLDKQNNNRIIPNLYAAGEVTGGVHGKNRLGGNSLLECTVFGRIIGQTIPIIQRSSLSSLELKQQQEQQDVPSIVSQNDKNRHDDHSLQSTNTTITIKELSQHNQPNDCWVSIQGIVYNVTLFAATEHPAGGNSIYNLAGKDATDIFLALHSVTMLHGLGKYQIGYLLLEGEQQQQQQITKGDINNDVIRDGNTKLLAQQQQEQKEQQNDNNGGNDNTEPLQTQIVTINELHRHNKPNDCWVAIYGIVYDLTSFADEQHPAGPMVIHNFAGEDATNAFSKFHNKKWLAGFIEDQRGILDGQEASIDGQQQQQLLLQPRQITQEELQQHNTKEDLWVAINGIVYDLTTFNHRGGAHLVTKLAGKDATKKFFNFHGEVTLLRVADRKIGTLELLTTATSSTG